MKKTKAYIFLISLLLMFVIMIFIVKFVDVGIWLDKEIGLYNLNTTIFNFIGYHKPYIFDAISDIIVYICYAMIIYLMLICLRQWIKGKTLKKVNQYCIAFGLSIVISMIVKLAFDYKIVINYRPILVDGLLKASFPSSHIYVTTFVILSISLLVHIKYNNKKLDIMMSIISLVTILTIFILRLLATMHWFTDCIAGVILGLILTNIFYIFLVYVKEYEEKKKSIKN